LNNQKVIEHAKCRLCKSADIETIFSLGEQFINNFVSEDQIGKGLKAPLDLFICNTCSLLQLKHTAPQELLYSGFYWYKSGVTKTMKNALKNVVDEACKQVQLKEGDVVLDIGANDGTLLGFYNENVCKVGCEPAKNLIDELTKVTPYVIDDFWTIENYNIFKKNNNLGKAKIITALGMFYDLEDPNIFISDVSDALDSNGIFVAQLMCLASMIKTNDLGNICHEHIEYYSLNSLKYLFEKNGLEIFKIEENNINGGSYRIYARHYINGSIRFNENIGKKEILDFKERIDLNKAKCVDFIKSEAKKGKKIYVYGASTKGNVILQYYGLNTDLIKAAAEKSPAKYGKYTIGSWIPIISEEDARNQKPDYFLVLPWSFFDEFYEKENEWLKGGGKFILPFPEFRVIGM
jgi:NDP-4-keto-2,6-dideoxyhexose 3-C-methyltransferase